MRILVLGATGNVGRRIVAEALDRGHKITAVSRYPAPFSELGAKVQVKAGNAVDARAIANLSMDQDLVISATRPAPGREFELVRTAEALLQGVKTSGVRLLLVGGAGSLIAPDTGRAIVDDRRYVDPAWRDIAIACCHQYAVCQNDATANWTYLSPPAALMPGARTGTYRLGTDELIVGEDGVSRISMEDLAVALIDEAEGPKHQRARFTVAY